MSRKQKVASSRKAAVAGRTGQQQQRSAAALSSSAQQQRTPRKQAVSSSPVREQRMREDFPLRERTENPGGRPDDCGANAALHILVAPRGGGRLSCWHWGGEQGRRKGNGVCPCLVCACVMMCGRTAGVAILRRAAAAKDPQACARE